MKNKAVLFAPHGDDETLFAFYTLLRVKPHVVVVLEGEPVRRKETAAAMEIAEVSWTQLAYSEVNPDWGDIADTLDDIASRAQIVITATPSAPGLRQTDRTNTTCRKTSDERWRNSASTQSPAGIPPRLPTSPN